MTPATTDPTKTHPIFTTFSTVENGKSKWEVLKITKDPELVPFNMTFTAEKVGKVWDSKALGERAAQITASLNEKAFVPCDDSGTVGPFISVARDFRDSNLFMSARVVLKPKDAGYTPEITPLAIPAGETHVFSHNSFKEALGFGSLEAHTGKDSNGNPILKPNRLPTEFNFFIPPSEGSI